MNDFRRVNENDGTTYIVGLLIDAFYPRRTWLGSTLCWVGSWSTVTVFTKAISVGVDTSNDGRCPLAWTVTHDVSSTRA